MLRLQKQGQRQEGKRISGSGFPEKKNTLLKATTLQEESGATDETVRESGVFTGPGGLGRLGREVGGLARPTCSNSRSYPEEMKTSISAEPRRSDTPNPLHFLAGSAAILCFHSWGPGATATATATAEPPAAYLHIESSAQAQGSNPVTHSGGKLKVLNVSVFHRVSANSLELKYAGRLRSGSQSPAVKPSEFKRRLMQRGRSYAVENKKVHFAT